MQCPQGVSPREREQSLCPLLGEWMDLVVVELSQTQPQTRTCQMNYSVNDGRSVGVVSPPSALCPDCDLLFDLTFHVLTIPFSCPLSLCSLELALMSFLFVFYFHQFPSFPLLLML